MRLLGGIRRIVRVYATTAWWGLVAPRWVERSPLVVAQAVTLRGEPGRREVLLSVRSDVQGWELPGGNPEPGEPITDALRREVLEETGFEVEVIRHVGDYVRSGFRPHTASVHVCEVVGGELVPSHETPVVRWFAVEALPDTLFPWYREPLADALAASQGPVSRSERQGLRAILAGVRIDLTMRLRAARGRRA